MNGGDPNIGFLKAMIAHHEDALKMSRAFLKVSATKRLPNVSGLAERIIKAQTEEIAKMRAMIANAATVPLRKNRPPTLKGG